MKRAPHDRSPACLSRAGAFAGLTAGGIKGFPPEIFPPGIEGFCAGRQGFRVGGSEEYAGIEPTRSDGIWTYGLPHTSRPRFSPHGLSNDFPPNDLRQVPPHGDDRIRRDRNDRWCVPRQVAKRGSERRCTGSGPGRSVRRNAVTLTGATSPIGRKTKKHCWLTMTDLSAISTAIWECWCIRTRT